jgi:hypothetical protein
MHVLCTTGRAQTQSCCCKSTSYCPPQRKRQPVLSTADSTVTRSTGRPRPREYISITVYISTRVAMQLCVGGHALGWLPAIMILIWCPNSANGRATDGSQALVWQAGPSGASKQRRLLAPEMCWMGMAHKPHAVQINSNTGYGSHVVTFAQPWKHSHGHTILAL